MTLPGSEHSRHSAIDVEVTLAALTIVDGALLVAAQGSSSCRLPKYRPNQQDSLDGVARSALTELVESDTGYIEQLYTFGFGYGEERVIVVSYLALVSGAPTPGQYVRWERVSAASECLSESDRIVLDYALIRLRAKIGYTTIAFHLMSESFALSDLQHTYETILDRPLDPRNFRRRIISSGLVQAENRKRRVGSHRPAALYRFAGNHDPASYLTPVSPNAVNDEETDMPRDTQ